MSDILFEAAVAYANETSDASIRDDLRMAFVAGAEWQWKRVEDTGAEVDRLRERLDIGPQGEDAIDVAESAMGFLRHRIETLEYALMPFAIEWADEHGWTEAACQRDRIVDWFGPSDFRRAKAALKVQP